MKDIIVSVPCYRLDGHLRFEDTTLSPAAIMYHINLYPFAVRHLVTPKIDAALAQYRQTIQDLLLAGV